MKGAFREGAKLRPGLVERGVRKVNDLGVEQAARELFRSSPGGETDERWEELPADERDWYRDRVRDVLRVYGGFAEDSVARLEAEIEGYKARIANLVRQRTCGHEWVTQGGETTCKLCGGKL